MVRADTSDHLIEMEQWGWGGRVKFMNVMAHTGSVTDYCLRSIMAASRVTICHSN